MVVVLPAPFTPTTKITLKQRLTKSRQKLGSGLTALLLGKKSIDDDLLEALEMLLIGADIGNVGHTIHMK
jgi:signal recognition particle GTPase